MRASVYSTATACCLVTATAAASFLNLNPCFPSPSSLRPPKCLPGSESAAPQSARSSLVNIPLVVSPEFPAASSNQRRGSGGETNKRPRLLPAAALDTIDPEIPGLFHCKSGVTSDMRKYYSTVLL